jgi:hypothetical protein
LPGGGRGEVAGAQPVQQRCSGLDVPLGRDDLVAGGVRADGPGADSGGRGSDRSPGEPLLYPSLTTRRPRSLQATTEDAMAVTVSDIRCLIFQRGKRQKGGRTRLQGTHRGLRPGPGDVPPYRKRAVMGFNVSEA